MNLRTLFWLSVITGCLMAPIAQGQSVTLDGFYDSSNAAEVNAYSNVASVGWKNGHNTAYDYWGPGTGDPTTWAQTTIRYGSGTLAGDTSTPAGTYYFLYVEAPLAVKGMSWSKDSSDLADYDKYVLGGAYLHQEVGDSGTPHITSMDYGKATGSEKVEFGSSNQYVGDFEEATGLNDGEAPGLIGLADSIDYLLANDHLLKAENGSAYDGNLANSTSVNPNIPMAFEFQFGNQTDLDAAVAAANNGIILHLSPSKVPEPSSLLLLGIASIGTLLRRKR
ncbi:PEP-CTERM sorting domain-containing protein [Akkermansiaceae bacterium]|nr:PEP-CTERM sorting domain-containing protein [Akkermansiaceae bacterium]MDC1406129.1 PEP-CTERM sorting domain-containing protein [Akkermansiaceae bacterium]